MTSSRQNTTQSSLSSSSSSSSSSSIMKSLSAMDSIDSVEKMTISEFLGETPRAQKFQQSLIWGGFEALTARELVTVKKLSKAFKVSCENYLLASKDQILYAAVPSAKVFIGIEKRSGPYVKYKINNTVSAQALIHSFNFEDGSLIRRPNSSMYLYPSERNAIADLLERESSYSDVRWDEKWETARHYQSPIYKIQIVHSTLFYSVYEVNETKDIRIVKKVSVKELLNKRDHDIYNKRSQPISSDSFIPLAASVYTPRQPFAIVHNKSFSETGEETPSPALSSPSRCSIM